MERDFDPPEATRMMPIAVMRTVGTSAASMNVMRARCRKTEVGERCLTPLRADGADPR